jgi:5-formyltetrahydrofolate cyclo-ligase
MTSKVSATAELKAILRREALNRRREVHENRAYVAAADLAKRLSADIEVSDNIIAGYWPIGGEIDCRPAMEKLASEGAQIVLPVVAGQGEVLIFRAWKPGDELETGLFGTTHPGPRATVRTPGLLLLPLVAFDRVGHRLGYGAGYYDRTIVGLRARGSIMAIGVGYDEQEIERMPADDHDQAMDVVVTDKRTLWFNGAGSGQ